MGEIYAVRVWAAAVNRIPYPNKFVKGKMMNKKRLSFTWGEGPRMPHAHASGFPSPCCGLPDDREGQALALQ